jgi:type I restriction enzyme M protein
VTPEECLALPSVAEAIARGFIVIKNDRVTYKLHRDTEYDWLDPEEWVRCADIAFLIVECGYPPKRLATEVQVPRRVPNDWADIVVFEDDRCTRPYLVVECKADPQNQTNRAQGIEQAIGNAHSLRAPLAFYDEWGHSVLFDTSGAYGAMERTKNRRGDRSRVPAQYAAEAPKYSFVAKHAGSDISPADARRLESKVRRTHSLIWSGGKRDPLTSFDEWSKLLFAKVHDERTTPNGKPRRFQVGSNETDTAVANRIHHLFAGAAQQDKTIFPEGVRINLPDEKIAEVVRTLQDISITDTDADTIGRAFEQFFGSVFRGELGQYFTMRQIARFTVAAIGISHTDYVIDPTAGSGGFLLEALLQGWHSIESNFAGSPELISRNRYDFAMLHVFGIEIHNILARILKINLLLHHDGHTNIEGDRSCLDTQFINQRLATNWRGGFNVVLGNPPFGDTVRRGDRDLLGENHLESFEVARGRNQVPSEHVIIERGLDMLMPGGRLAFVVPDGLLNNQGDQSNCPNVRRFLARTARIEAIVSLPDHAFRKSGAQNKTSILFLRKYTEAERKKWVAAYQNAKKDGASEDVAIAAALTAVEYRVFLAEANFIGYTPSGQKSDKNDLYRADAGGFVAEDQSDTILGEFRRFYEDPNSYTNRRQPDCIALSISEMWNAHQSHRLDPKYFIFKVEEETVLPTGWVRSKIGKAMKRRIEQIRPELVPEDEVVVLTVAQSGDLRARAAGKGMAPPEWRGMYFEDMPTKWYRVKAGDVVFSRIDLWKGCIAVVPPEFDGALVSGEFPIYEVVDERLDAEFLSTLLRSRYYQRAFRAITTGHSNRRRTQEEDFEELEICFPADPSEQRDLVADVLQARKELRGAEEALHEAMLHFSDRLDQRGDQEYETDPEEDGGEE